jgi:catechol 2,3-dioxygenase-like lactoylglutathione lyase family enzyme
VAGSARVGNKTGRVRHPHASPANKKDDNVVHDSPRAATRRRGTLRDGVRRETSTIDHIGFPVSDYPRSKAFYEKALAPLGYTLIMEVGADHTDSGSPAAGFGKQGKPDFWIGGDGGLKATLHVAIADDDRGTVDAFYRAALAAGGRDNGAPGLRPQYHPNYYGAFVLDPDGHNIEAVCHAPA